MATVTPSLKVSAAIANTLSGVSSGTLYTCPANSYAIVNIMIGNITTPTPGANFPFRFLVATRQVFEVFFITTTTFITSNDRAAATTYPSTAYNISPSQPIYIGPGQTLTVGTGGGGAANWYVTGVEFINS